jgi:hypothetical protein
MACEVACSVAESREETESKLSFSAEGLSLLVGGSEMSSSTSALGTWRYSSGASYAAIWRSRGEVRKRRSGMARLSVGDVERWGQGGKRQSKRGHDQRGSVEGEAKKGRRSRTCR